MDTTAVGRAAEEVAANWLLGRGLQLIEKNARTRFFELDLVMEQAEQVVFIEVKYRSSADFGGGTAAISADKQRRLLAGAQAWLIEKGWQDRPIRFDVITVTGNEESRKLEHFPDCLVLDE